MTPAEQAFATKTLTRWLPTGKRLEKYGATATACHRCGEDETVDHLFLCIGQKQWASAFLRRLDTYLLDINTEPDIRKALIAGINNWLNPEAADRQRAPYSTREYVRLQNEIGWNLTFCGLFDENWCAMQEQYLSTNNTRHSDENGIAWSVKLCSWMIREARQVWLSRNEDVHKLDEGKSKSEQALFEQIQKLYALRDEVGHHDRALFDEPIEEKLGRPFPFLRQWARNTVSVINKCILDYQNKLRTGQKDIRQYFQREQPLPPIETSTQSESTNPE